MRTSTRWMAAAGMLLRSTPALSPGEAKLARRRPLSRISVLETPMPRRLAPLKPRWPEVPSVMLAPSVSGAVFALSVRTSSAAVVTPRLEISSRVMTSTGSAVSPSTRLMREPVTTILSIVVTALSPAAASVPDSSWARAGSAASAAAMQAPSTLALRRSCRRCAARDCPDFIRFPPRDGVCRFSGSAGAQRDAQPMSGARTLRPECRAGGRRGCLGSPRHKLLSHY